MNSKDTEAEPVKEKKLDLHATWQEVARKQKGLMALMILLTVMSGLVLVVALITMRPPNVMPVVGYVDIYGQLTGRSAGYRNDAWWNMLAFPVLAVLFGTVHNVIALRAYRKYGKEIAMMVVLMTILLVVGDIVVMLRLLGEW